MYFEHEFDIAHIWPATLINLTSFVKLSLQNCTVRENINLSLEKYLKYINYLTIAILFFFFLIYRQMILLDSIQFAKKNSIRILS